MKIVYLHQYFATPEMGGGTRSYEFAKFLADSGHTVDVVTSDKRRTTSTWEVEAIDGFVVHRVGVEYSNSMSFSRRLQAFAQFASRSASRASHIDCDVVFATSTPLTIALPAIYASLRRRRPFVFEVRDLWPEAPIALGALRNPLMKLAALGLEQLAYRSARHIVTLSPGMQEGVERAGVSRDRISMIPNACDFEIFDVPSLEGQRFRKQYPWLDDRPLVVYAGSLGYANGVEYLARVAVEALKLDSELRFLVIGDGKERGEILDLAAKLGVLHENFFWSAPMGKAEVAAALSAATFATSLFLPNPTLRNNSPNKFFDALAAGRPVAVNHDGWIADLIRGRECGVVLPLNPVAAAALLIDKVGDADWLTKAQVAASELGHERFDRSQLATELERVLLDVVQGV